MSLTNGASHHYSHLNSTSRASQSACIDLRRCHVIFRLLLNLPCRNTSQLVFFQSLTEWTRWRFRRSLPLHRLTMLICLPSWGQDTGMSVDSAYSDPVVMNVGNQHPPIAVRGYFIIFSNECSCHSLILFKGLTIREYCTFDVEFFEEAHQTPHAGSRTILWDNTQRSARG